MNVIPHKGTPIVGLTMDVKGGQGPIKTPDKWTILPLKVLLPCQHCKLLVLKFEGVNIH